MTASITCLVSLYRIDVSWVLVVLAVPYIYPLNRRSLLLSLALDSNIHLKHWSLSHGYCIVPAVTLTNTIYIKADLGDTGPIFRAPHPS
jgi:hypothetical protein